MHDPKLTYNHIREDLLLQSMQKFAVEGDTLNFLDFIAMLLKSIVLISSNRCVMVGVGLGASLEGEN